MTTPRPTPAAEIIVYCSLCGGFLCWKFPDDMEAANATGGNPEHADLRECIKELRRRVDRAEEFDVK